MRAPTLARVMREIAAGTLSRADAAEQLGCSERTVNRLMKERGVERPESPVHEARAAAAARREAKRDAARSVLDKSKTAEQAAAAIKVSVRTIYRWVNRLEKPSKRRKTRGKPRKSSK